MTTKGNLVLGPDFAEGHEYVPESWTCPACGAEPEKLTLSAWLRWLEIHAEAHASTLPRGAHWACPKCGLLFLPEAVARHSLEHDPDDGFHGWIKPSECEYG